MQVSIKYSLKHHEIYINLLNVVNLYQSYIVLLIPGHIVYFNYIYLMFCFVILINNINI